MKTKHKLLSVLLALCMVFCIAPTAVFAADNVPDSVWTDYAAAEFAGGTGTETDPYQIATAEQLAKLSKDVSGGSNYQGNYFQLTENIDLSSHRWTPIGIWKWKLDSSTTNESFQGFLDGNHKTISGLVVDESIDKNAAGLFGNIRSVSGGTVGAKDLTISSANIYADETELNDLYAGIFAGYVLANSGEQVVFENISVSGAVVVKSTNGHNSVGGMIGYGDRIKATNCKAENISVEGASNSGGFIGLAGGSVFENCKVSGTVSGKWSLGGFVGYSYSASLDDSETSVYEKCAADVKIEGADWRLGGFAGYAESGKFDNCVAFGDVASTVNGWEPKVGSFIGESYSVAATACHAAGTVTSESLDYEAGGFVGCYTDGTFEGCSFDNEKNSGLAAAGVGTISAGVAGCNSNDVLANICKDYYGGHIMQKTDKVEATCTTAGKEAYYTCEVCQKHFEDETGNIGITDLGSYGVIEKTAHTLQKTDKVEATCTTAGKEAYYTCEVCQKHFSDEEGKNEITKLEEYGMIPATEHKAGTEWKHNETSHWNECMNNCGEKVNEAVHSYEWVVDKEATATEAGSKHEECSVCGYERAAVEIPATGKTDPTNPPKPTVPDKKKPDTGITSPQTGDKSNMALWVALFLASGGALTAVTVYSRKRRKTE